MKYSNTATEALRHGERVRRRFNGCLPASDFIKTVAQAQGLRACVPPWLCSFGEDAHAR
jgi:hypothetical protein